MINFRIRQSLIASIKPEMKVLEPSAGNGNIGTLIQEIEKVELDVIERSPDLREILELKGFNLVGNNSLEHYEKYDRILMNPAWEKQHDIDEILHCYENCLLPGGRMVAICSGGSISRSDKKARNFQDWLESIDAVVEKLPPDAFVPSGYRVQGVLLT